MWTRVRDSARDLGKQLGPQSGFNESLNAHRMSQIGPGLMQRGKCQCSEIYALIGILSPALAEETTTPVHLIVVRPEQPRDCTTAASAMRLSAFSVRAMRPIKVSRFPTVLNICRSIIRCTEWLDLPTGLGLGILSFQQGFRRAGANHCPIHSSLESTRTPATHSSNVIPRFWRYCLSPWLGINLLSSVLMQQTSTNSIRRRKCRAVSHPQASIDPVGKVRRATNIGCSCRRLEHLGLSRYEYKCS